MDKSILESVELDLTSTKPTKISDSYLIRQNKKAPHLNSMCCLLNSDNQTAKLDSKPN